MKRFLPLLALLGCDEVITVRNAPPTVTLTAFCTDAQGQVFFGAEVVDLEGDPVDVDLVAEVGGQRVVLASGAAGDGTVGLSGDEAGVAHLIEWGACEGDGCVDPCADRPLGPSRVSACSEAPAALPESIEVTVFATDGGGVSEATTTLTREPCP